MPNILLGTTGSVAAIRTPELYQKLVAAGFPVKVVATQAALYFFDPASLTSSPAKRELRDPEVVVLDEDEWFRRKSDERYQRDDPVLHIELRRWADLLLIAPLDANTLAKLAYGLADNCLTCVWRAWDPARPVVLAPAMNTLMWDSPLTRRHLQLVTETMGGTGRLRIIAPQSRRLACGDIGMGALADVEDIVSAVSEQFSQQSHYAVPGE
jgi:phosphopantothenoylcysteine decarboxylase